MSAPHFNWGTFCFGCSSGDDDRHKNTCTFTVNRKLKQLVSAEEQWRTIIEDRAEAVTRFLNTPDNHRKFCLGCRHPVLFRIDEHLCDSVSGKEGLDAVSNWFQGINTENFKTFGSYVKYYYMQQARCTVDVYGKVEPQKLPFVRWFRFADVIVEHHGDWTFENDCPFKHMEIIPVFSMDDILTVKIGGEYTDRRSVYVAPCGCFCNKQDLITPASHCGYFHQHGCMFQSSTDRYDSSI